jgi:signal transduction histidine kinase
VLRHSAGKSAFVHVLCQDSELLLKIGNEAADGGPDTGDGRPGTGDGRPGTAEFTPRSIRERTLALGGKLFIERRADGYTVVHVSIPMN